MTAIAGPGNSYERQTLSPGSGRTLSFEAGTVKVASSVTVRVVIRDASGAEHRDGTVWYACFQMPYVGEPIRLAARATVEVTNMDQHAADVHITYTPADYASFIGE